MTTLAASMHKATEGAGVVAFGALVDYAAGTAGVPKIWRGRGVVGDYAGAEVLLYDAAGNPLLITDDTAFTPGTSPVVPVGFLADETSSDQVDEGDVGAARMTLSRIMRAVLSTGAGASLDVGSGALSAATLRAVLATDQPAIPVNATPVAPATGTVIGNVGGVTTVVTVTPVVSTTPAYTAGDNVGAKLTLASAVRVSGGGGVIQSVVLADKGKQSAALDLVFFNANPGSTFTDNTAQTLSDADLLTIIGVVPILATDYSAFADNSVAAKLGLGLSFKAVGSTSIYACLVARGTPTYTSTGDLQLIVSILSD